MEKRLIWKKMTVEMQKNIPLEEQKKLVSEIAWAVNTYLPVLDLYEKTDLFFLNEKTIAGWPIGKELQIGLSTKPSEFFIIKWMLDGKLKPASK